MLLQREKSQVLMVDIQERLLPAMAQPGEVAGSGANLLEGARLLAGPILVSEQYPVGLGRTVPELATTEMVLFEWLRQAGTPDFKSVRRLIRYINNQG